MKISPVYAVKKYKVTIDDEYDACVEIANGTVVGWLIPPMLYDPAALPDLKDIAKFDPNQIPNPKYTLDEIKNAILGVILKKENSSSTNETAYVTGTIKWMNRMENDLETLDKKIDALRDALVERLFIKLP